jgi:hypothetical protein
MMGRTPKSPGGRGLVCFVVIGLASGLQEISERIFCLPFAVRLWCPGGAKMKLKGPHRRETALGLELIRRQ